MGMVLIQLHISVSKLKKIKTKFLHCTGYLNSRKNPVKQDVLQKTSDTLIGYLPIFLMLSKTSLCIRYHWYRFE